MKLTKEDLMRLPKERLAELIVEMTQTVTLTEPAFPIMPAKPVAPVLCDGSHCANPLMDCINCPRNNSTVYVTTKSPETKYYGD